MTPSFGDKVRIKATKEAEAIGVGGFVGQVYGQTTPSSSGVEVIGLTENDYAINVHFEPLGKGFWFAPELVELVDHGEGAEIRLQGIDKRWIRTKDGRWREGAPAARKWWKLW